MGTGLKWKIFKKTTNKIRFLSGDYMEKKRNNSQWICDSIEELIEEYERRCDDTYDYAVLSTYRTVIEELEIILYG